MSSKRRRRGRTRGDSAAASRDAETVRTVNHLILQSPVDVRRLRKIAAVKGLVNDGLRARVWPLLLGVEAGPHDPAAYAARYSGGHKDSHVVDCDMARSLWSFTQGWSEEAREERRDALRRVLNAAVDSNEQGVHYYQGLHDVAAVLLFTCGEAAAYRLLAHLAACHLWDCTRPTLDAAVEMLSLLYPILKQCDPELHAYVTGFGEPALEVPYFALSWTMTWFAHDVADRAAIARLFDLFIGAHPLMPLYTAAVAMRGNRGAILACGADGDRVYATLKAMRILAPGQPSADDLARQAAELYQALPPPRLLRMRRRQLGRCTTVHAFLTEAGHWRVPEEPPPPPAGQLAAQRVQQLGAALWPPRRQSKARLLAAVLSSLGGLAALGAAVLLSQMQPSQR